MNREITIRFVRNYTVEPLGLAIQEKAVAAGWKVQTEFGAYENSALEIAETGQSTVAAAILIVTLDLDFFAGGIHSPRWSLEEVRGLLDHILRAIDSVPVGTYVLISTFLPPFRTPLPWAPGHPVLCKSAAAFELNAMVRDFVGKRTQHCGLLDFERIAASLGEIRTVDRRFGLMNKAPFKPEFINAAAEEVTRILRCRFQPPKKALVLDCDNTLWGGVVGEVGVAGVQLDPYEYPGVAYYQFQSEILAIAEKGVLVCLNSKNDPAAVWEVLDRHPHSLLKRRHLAAHRINWTDKATNLKDLALELNLGLDSMVFVDDNPAECELIRSQFPEVSVLVAPRKIYELPGLLENSGFFDRLSINEEDKERVHYYQAEKGRRELQERHVDARGFLRELNMKASVRPMRDSDLSRAAQLCQRTNQFNLTSKRYAESDLAEFLQQPDIGMFLLQAEDRFGSMGVSGLIIWKKKGLAAEVDTFLMSCRIIGRFLDHALFCESLRQVKERWSVTEAKASFVPTKKNGIVARLWSEYGFKKVDSSNEDMYHCRLAELKVSFPDVVTLQ